MTTKVTNIYNLKLTPSQFGQSSLVVNCSQYDSLFRVIQFNLFNGNSIYSIPEGSVVTIRGTKKDNTGFEYECEYSNNVVTFPLQQQITIFPGKVPAELRITKEGEIIGSWNFLFLVEESPLSDETTISETQLPLLEQAIEASDRLNEAFDDIAEFTDETYPNAVQAIQSEGATQVSNVTNEGTTQRGLVSSEGATQIANIQAEGTTQKGLVTSEGTTQVANVQAKGDEVIESIPSDYTELIGEVEDLKSAIDDLPFDRTEIKSGNLLNPANVTAGYYWTDGYHSSTSYVNSGLVPIEYGKTYTQQVGESGIAINRSIISARFIIYYAADGTTVTGSGSNVRDIIAPTENTAYYIGSYNYLSVENFLATKPAVVEGTTVLDYEEYFPSYTEIKLKDIANSPQTEQNTLDIADLKDQMAEEGHENGIFSVNADSLAANTNLICCDSCDNKKNEYIELTAKFSTFGELTIAHGKGSYMGGYITITASKLLIYTYNGTQIEEYDHGLTIADFINVIIYTKNDSSCRSKITIMSSGGDYTASTTRYYSCRAAVLCNATFAMTDVQMKYTVNDAKEDVWVFGDSYISMGDPNRWATQAVQDGHIKMMIHGFGGATSMNEIVPFRALLDVASPKFIVWALGMNDGDTSSAVNTNWKTCVDEVIATCEAKGITLILATIPNVPNVMNTFKNDYVKSTGLRYVDFAKAVNAESAGATWYTGMLSSDNTHPTELGAKALMRQFLQDVPEVLYAED